MLRKWFRRETELDCGWASSLEQATAMVQRVLLRHDIKTSVNVLIKDFGNNEVFWSVKYKTSKE